jgi:hypothetical protein
MAEPTATTIAGSGVAVAAIMSLIPGVDASQVLGAFSGSVVFVLASDDLAAWRKVAYFMLSFIGGLLAAGFASATVSFFLPAQIAVSHGVGALLASALVVKLLLWLISRDPSSAFDFLKGKRP